jgi:hypothetical protein
MSAGIILANKNGLVISTDSAGTIAGKIVLESQKKIFLLDKNKNYLIALVGNAGIADNPWSIIIEEYAFYIKDHNLKFNKVVDLVSHFTEFLKKEKNKFNFDQGEKFLITRHIDEGIEFIHEEMLRNPTYKKAIQQEKLLETIIEHNLYLNNNFENKKEFVISEKVIHSEYIEFTINSLINKYSWFKKLTKDKQLFISEQFLKTFVKSLQKGWYSDRFVSTLAFCGIGDEELYPSVVKLEVFGFFKNQLLIVDQEVLSVLENDLLTLPLAQKDVFESFFMGTNESYNKLIIKKHDDLVRELLDESLKIGLPKEMYQKMQKIHKTKFDNFIEFTKAIQAFELNKLMAINNAETNDLVDIARQIIQVTILKRKYENSHLYRTVGGKIETYVIQRRKKPLIIKEK